MADPFDVANSDTYADPNAPSRSTFDSPDFYRNLTAFGAATMAAANERTPQGFLKYGTGVAGPVGAGMLGAMEQNRQNAQLQSQIGLRGAQTSNLRQEQIAKKIATAQGLGQYNALAPLYGTPQLDPQGNPIPGGGGPSQSLYSSPSVTPTAAQPQGQVASGQQGGPSDVAAGIRGIENTSGNSGIKNSAGYLGNYQFGTAALTSAGLYTPAPGEDVTKNEWKGSINIPGVGSMNAQQFGANPQAQDAAFHVTAQHNMQLAQQNGMTQYVGQTVGGVPITPATLTAGMHFGGVEGTARFLATGGKYNPADSNGTTLSGYMGRVANIHQEIQGQQAQASGGMPQQQAAQPQDTMTLARGFLSGQLNNITPDQARQIAPLISRLQPELGKKLLDYGLSGQQAAAVSQAQGANQVPQGFQRTPDGRMVPIQGGPADPNYIGAADAAKVQSMRGPGAALVQNGRVISQVPMPVTRIDQKGNEYTEYVNPMMEGGQPGATAPGAPPGSVMSVQKTLGPEQHEYLEGRGESLAKQFGEIDTHATAAVEGNYLLDNMRRESQSWDMGKFASVEGEGRAYLSAFAHTLGIKAPELDSKLADFQAFQKSAGQITRVAVHETSSRAAAQEYQMIQSTLPSPNMSAQAFGQIADQMQGVYDYQIAKQRFAQQYQGKPGDMNIDWNKNVTPSAFMLNRMTQTPEGQQTLQEMLGKMGQTPQGRAVAARLQAEVRFAKTNGFFDNLETQQPQPVKQ